MYRLWKGCIFVKMYLLWCTNRYLWMQPYDIKWYHCLKYVATFNHAVYIVSVLSFWMFWIPISMSPPNHVIKCIIHPVNGMCSSFSYWHKYAFKETTTISTDFVSLITSSVTHIGKICKVSSEMLCFSLYSHKYT